MKYDFDAIFRRNPDGTITPRRTIQIGSATLGSSVTFGSGVSFSGVNIFNYVGAAVEADEENGILIIRGFYQRLNP